MAQMSVADRAAVKTLIVVGPAGAGNANNFGKATQFTVLDGSMRYVLGAHAVEATAVLAALAGLPGANIGTIAGGSTGGPSSTWSAHITRVTG